jgi:PadR family transcriptional regulator PadR
MRRRGRLGELEQLVLWTIIRLRDDAYGVPILRELEERAGRRLSIGALYATLERLEGKGYLTSRTGDPTPERGGRAKRFFRVTGAGAEALERSRDTLQRLWKGLRPVSAARMAAAR